MVGSTPVPLPAAEVTTALSAGLVGSTVINSGKAPPLAGFFHNNCFPNPTATSDRFLMHGGYVRSELQSGLKR